MSVLEVDVGIEEGASDTNFDGRGLFGFETNPLVMFFGIVVLVDDTKLLVLGEPKVGGAVLERVEESPENSLLEGAPNGFVAGWLDGGCEPKEPPKTPFAFGGAFPNAFDWGGEDAPNITVDGFLDGLGVVLFAGGPDGAPKMLVVAAS